MSLNRILSLLSDGQWHDAGDVSAKTNIPLEKLQKALNFMADFNVIEKDGTKVKLQPTLMNIAEAAQ